MIIVVRQTRRRGAGVTAGPLPAGLLMTRTARRRLSQISATSPRAIAVRQTAGVPSW
jgi:hypothetical protein